jgi:putative transposase
MRQAAQIVLTPEEKAQLKNIVGNPKINGKLKDRVKIVLLAAMNQSNELIAKTLNFSEARVGKWRSRFAENRLRGISVDAPRVGRPPKVRERLTKTIVEMTLTQPPPAKKKYWSARELAKILGVSHTSVHRIWRDNKINPRKTPPTVLDETKKPRRTSK